MKIDGLASKKWPSQPTLHDSARMMSLALTTSFSLFLSLLRLAKEEVAYKTEAKQQEEKIERLKAEGGDEYVIKKQVFTTRFILF